MTRFCNWVRGAVPLLLAATLSRTAYPAEAARLVYGRTDEARACPDEGALREAVARRLGYDPFVSYSALTLVVEIRGDTNGLSARVYRVESGNVAGGVRQLSSPSPNCKELASAVALAISIAIDPDSIERMSAEPRTASAEAPGAAAEEPPFVPPPTPSPKPDSKPIVTQPSAASPSSPPIWSVGVGPAIASGPAPAPLFEVAALLGIRGEHWAATLEPRMSFPTSADHQAGAGGTARMSFYGATLSPCYRYGSLLGCYVIEGGLAVSSGEEVQQPRTDHSFWWAQGLRAGFRWDAGSGLGVSARLDGLWAPQQITLRVNGEDVFETPRVLVRFGAFVDYEF